jgi:dihydrofolate reductase
VSSTLDRVDWNAELVRGDLGKAVQQLKRESGKGLLVGGVKLPLALAELGLIDEYEFVVHPRLAGHGPTLFAGLSKRVERKIREKTRARVKNPSLGRLRPRLRSTRLRKWLKFRKISPGSAAMGLEHGMLLCTLLRGMAMERLSAF